MKVVVFVKERVNLRFVDKDDGCVVVVKSGVIKGVIVRYFLVLYVGEMV